MGNPGAVARSSAAVVTTTVQGAELLAQSRQLALRAQRRSTQTLNAYGDGVRFHLAWCAENDLEPMVCSSLDTWTATLLDDGAAAATARARQLGVRRFASWLAEGGEIPADPFVGIKSPKLDERAVDRYLRLRRGHRLAESPDLWLGTVASASPTTPCTRACARGPTPLA